MNTGLTKSNERNAGADNCWLLILYNDQVNTQQDVALAIYNCTGDGSLSKSIMMMAHVFGNSIIGYGKFSTLVKIKKQLNIQNLTISLTLIDGNFSIN